MTGGRFTASTSPAETPVVQSAGTFARRKALATSTDTWPATVIFITSSVSASVTRRPPTCTVFSPSFFDSSVAWGPPPCTTATFTPASRKAAHRAAHGAGELLTVARQLSAHLHHEPLARLHGHSPGSARVARSSKPIITLKA